MSFLLDYRLLYPVVVTVTTKRISVERQLSERRQHPGQVADHSQLVKIKLINIIIVTTTTIIIIILFLVIIVIVSAG